MGSERAICWRTVMKNRIWTWVECWRSEYKAAVRSASERTRNPGKQQRRSVTATRGKTRKS